MLLQVRFHTSKKAKHAHIYFYPDIRPIWNLRTRYLILPRSVSLSKPEEKNQNVIFYSFSSTRLHLQRYFHDHTDVYLVPGPGMIIFLAWSEASGFSIQCFHRLWNSTLQFVFAGGGGLYGCITEGDLDTVLKKRAAFISINVAYHAYTSPVKRFIQGNKKVCLNL